MPAASVHARQPKTGPLARASPPWCCSCRRAQTCHLRRTPPTAALGRGRQKRRAGWGLWCSSGSDSACRTATASGLVSINCSRDDGVPTPCLPSAGQGRPAATPLWPAHTCLRGTNLAVRTGRSVTSKDLTSDCGRQTQCAPVLDVSRTAAGVGHAGRCWRAAGPPTDRPNRLGPQAAAAGSAQNETHLLRIVPDVHMAVVQRRQDPVVTQQAVGSQVCTARLYDKTAMQARHWPKRMWRRHAPWLRGVQLHALHAVRPLREDFLRQARQGAGGAGNAGGSAGRQASAPTRRATGGERRRPRRWPQGRHRPLIAAGSLHRRPTLMSSRSGCRQGKRGAGQAG